MSTPDDRYTHGHHDSVLRSHRWRTVDNSAGYLLGRLVPGVDVLDVGCGPGTITLDLAARVAPGRVVGLDRAEDVVDAARAAAEAGGVADVEFVSGNVYDLDLADDSFDVVHAHQVLQHLSDPVAALVEMRRVTRPGGVVAVRDSDYSAMTWYPESPGLDRWLDLYRELARANDAEPDAGRRLRAWALEAGFTDVAATASAWCFAADDDRQWWGSMWADRVVASAFAEQAIGRGVSTVEELDSLADAWRSWAASPDAWFAVLHGEILARA